MLARRITALALRLLGNECEFAKSFTEGLFSHDTLGYFEKLKAADIPEAHAKAQVEVIREVIEDKLATKQDFKELTSPCI